eukprot:CAMPEP_0117531082 /NCGR_PEP_ID=MMETSP0784-20121206/38677_1 /TAXON_ID=39447 /ORGANISM="" /LENGTH=48 /DNA_ID= /DNA_START= /DNA_END= /DNA_ORIENTATION=
MAAVPAFVRMLASHLAAATHFVASKLPESWSWHFSNFDTVASLHELKR